MRPLSIQRMPLCAAALLFFPLLSGLLAERAVAAPFCIQNQVIPPQCMYFDPTECLRDAQRQNAICSANPNEVRLSQGIGQYCLVTSSLVSLCVYADREPCEIDARRQGGTCTNSPQRAPAGAPDPYAAIGGR